MKNKYFYPIFKLKAKSWIRYWLLKQTEFKGKLSEILTGFTFNLQNTLRQKFVKFEIEGHSVQNGTPSPENEVPIKSSGDSGSITEKIINKNWFNNSDEPLITNSVTVQHITDGLRIINRGTNQHNNAMYKIMDVKNYLGQKITFTAHAKSSASNPGMIYLRVADKNGENFVTGAITSSTTLDGNLSTTITIPDSLPENAHTLVCSLYATRFVTPAVGDYVDYTNLQIELGSTATDYVPHEEQTYTIPVQAPFRSIGDVRDDFVKVDGVWYERHKIARHIFDGTEIINYDGQSNWTFRYAATPSAIYTYSSNYNYVKCNWIQGKSTNNDEAITDYQGLIAFRYDLYKTGTPENFKTWLAQLYANGTPLYVDYVLAELTLLPCTEEQIGILENLPITYKNQTTIYSTDEVEAYLKIQYWESDTNG